MVIVLGFNRFWLFFLLDQWPMFCTTASVVIFFFFYLLLLLHFFYYEFHFTLFNHYAHLGTYVHIYSYVQTMKRITTTAVLSLLIVRVCIWHKTGTHRDQVKNTRLPPQNSFGALWHPDPTQTWSQSDLSHSNWTWTRRSMKLAAGRVHLWASPSENG